MPRIPLTTRKQRKRIEREKELGHHIPDVLIEQISDLRSVHHKDELSRFAQVYRDKSFSRLEEEYEEIRRSISNLLANFFPSSLNDAIVRSMNACLAVRGMTAEDSYREHFIHPFQIFLSGSVIVDRFYEKFKIWYDDELCASNETCLESAWLLTTLFHDRAKEINTLRELLEYDIGDYGKKIPNEDRYIQLLSSFHAHRKARNEIREWSVSAPEDSDLKAILCDYSERWAHGIKGSVLMLRHICADPESVSPRDISSAFAIAVHDSTFWDKLACIGVFPMSINLFPLPCLLLYLDTVQEWSRHPIVDTEVRLVNMSMNNRSVAFEISFESNTAARRKLVECEKAQQCVLSEEIELSMSAKVRLNR